MWLDIVNIFIHKVGRCSTEKENFTWIHWGMWRVTPDYTLIIYYEGQLLPASKVQTCAADKMLTSPVRQLNKADSPSYAWLANLDVFFSAVPSQTNQPLLSLLN